MSRQFVLQIKKITYFCGRAINGLCSLRYFFFLILVKAVVTQAKELRLCRDDFELLKVIGKGAFGEVAVVRMRGVGEVCVFFLMQFCIPMFH